MHDRLVRALEGVDGWLSLDEADALYDLAATALRRREPFQAVEIGSWKGRSTIALGLGIQERLGGGVLWAVDHHTGSAEHREMYGAVDTYAEFQANVGSAGLLPIVRPLRSDSVMASCGFAPGCLSLLWIDGSHDYDSVASDLDAWLPKLAAGAVLALDDWNLPSVRTAAEERLTRAPRIVGKIAIFDAEGRGDAA